MTLTVLESFTVANDTGKKLLIGVIDTSEACIRRCQWHRQSMYLLVSMTPAKHDTGVIDTGDVMHHRCHWYQAVNIANFASVNDTGEAYLCRCQWHRLCMHYRCRWHRWCTSMTLGSSPSSKESCQWHRRSTAKVKYLHEYSKKIEIVTRLVYWEQEKLFEEKNQRWKIWWNCPFKAPGVKRRAWS